MSLPKSVQAQAERAARHFETPANPEEPPQEAAPTPEQDRNPPERKTPPDEPNAEEGAQPAKEPAKSEPKAESDDALYWQHRFNVLQGKYNSETKALRDESTDLKRQVADKDRRIAELEKQPSGTGNAGDLSDEQLAQFKQEFGEDLVSFVERMVDERAAPTPKPDDSRVQQLDERLSRFEQEQQQDAQARFWVALERAVPTFREVNADPKFHQFLTQFDPQTGKQRQQALIEAQQTLDAKGVADVFQLYLKQAGQAPAPKPQIPDDQVDPRTTRTTQAPQGKRRWSRAEISQFYRDKTAGRVGAEEAERLEADIFAAQQEGRVY